MHTVTITKICWGWLLTSHKGHGSRNVSQANQKFCKDDCSATLLAFLWFAKATRWPDAVRHLFCFFSLRIDALNSSILTDQRNLFAIPRLYYSGNQTQTCGTEISIICVQTRALWRGLQERRRKFSFLGTRKSHFGSFSGQFEYSCLDCITVLMRPTPALRSVKKDRNGVPVVKKRTGTAFRCVPVPNEPWLLKKT